MTEDELDARIRKIARGLRVHAHHKRDSRDEAPGFPDFVLIGARGVLWREDKTETGSLTPEQRQVGKVLTAMGYDWSVWRPRDLWSGRIRRELEAIA